MPLIPDRQFTQLLGCLVLALMALTVWQRRYPEMLGRAAEHSLLGVSAGVAIGVATMLANAAGAITAFYFLARRMDKMAFVGTAAWFYLIVNLTKVPFSIQLNLINPASLSFDLILLPVVALGCAAGRLLLRSVPQQLFEWITIATASAAALRLILTA
jgi:uncharacterized membrane protein YfcA